MRKELKKDEGQRKTFRAVFVRLGKKTGYTGHSVETVLLRDVVDVATDQKVTDHIWFTLTKGFEAILQHEGATIEFDARVKSYTKGYVNSRYKVDQRKNDYKLSNPTRIKVI
jgi:hypothetical protein